MEMEDWEMFECVDDIVNILENRKELKGRPEAQQAVNNLKKLKQSEITTQSEDEVCKEALVYVSLKSKELEQTIEDAKNFICDEKKDSVERLQQAADKHKEDVKDIGDQLTGTAKETIQTSLLERLYDRVNKLGADVDKVDRGACSEASSVSVLDLQMISLKYFVSMIMRE